MPFWGKCALFPGWRLCGRFVGLSADCAEIGSGENGFIISGKQGDRILLVRSFGLVPGRVVPFRKAVKNLTSGILPRVFLES